MKWVLVVLVAGAPVQTNLVFDKLTDCIAAEEQLQQAYADAYAIWNQRFIAGEDRSERRRHRDYRRAKESEARKFANTGTCIPHAGSDQPVISTNKTPESANSSPTNSPAATSPTAPAKP